jgi:hypothetical protein
MTIFLGDRELNRVMRVVNYITERDNYITERDSHCLKFLRSGKIILILANLLDFY